MRKNLILASAVLAGGFVLQACGGGGIDGGSIGIGGGSNGSGSDTGTTYTQSGTVVLYATDDKLDNAGRVEVKIKQIRMENSGTGTSCNVFSPQTPYPVDLTDLKNTLELLDTANCPEGQYNRLVVVLEQKPVEVIYNGNSFTCSIKSYDPSKDNRRGAKPNRTACSDQTGECIVEVTGAINILANQTNEVALDFELKDSEIDLNANPCTVAFRVSPLHASGLDTAKGNKKEEIKGFASDLDTEANSFTLTTKAGISFTVNYSDDAYDTILQLAQDKSLRVEVECSNFDIGNATCTAKSVELKVEGIALNVDANNKTLTVDIDGDKTTTNDQISVSLDQNGEWEGNIQNDLRLEVEIVGHNGYSYVAKEVEMEMEKD